MVIDRMLTFMSRHLAVPPDYINIDIYIYTYTLHIVYFIGNLNNNLQKSIKLKCHISRV